MLYLQSCQLPVQILYMLSAVCFKDSFSIEGKYTKNVNNYKVVYPVRISDADDSSSRYRRWEGDDYTILYQLPLGGNEELLDLEPNLNIVSKGAVLERRTHTVSDSEPLSNVQLEEPSYTQCFFKGKVRNYDDSSTALSTCGGLCGFIRVKRHTYFIEPVEIKENEIGKEQPHLLYEQEQNDMSAINCATNFKKDAIDNNKDNSFFRENLVTTGNADAVVAHSSNSSNKRLHMETLLVMDKSMMDVHDPQDLQNYALTVFNMAQSLFHDLNTDPPIDLEIVRIIEVEDPKDILNTKRFEKLGTNELDAFSEWQLRINPKDENHPNHHDLAILLTGNQICDEEGYCEHVGLAETKGACRPKRQAAICKDTGLMLGYVIAHQIAHTLGVGHDLGEVTQDGTSSVMSPAITLSPKIWTDKSRIALTSAFQDRQLDCLEDEPVSEFKVSDILPGVMYDADYQCQQLLTPDARSCSKIGDCQNLACAFEGTSCSNTGVMPAPGTSCGENKWCFDGTCLEAGKRPSAVEGNWGAWSEWSHCSRTCGSGVSSAKRECDSPAPMHGGKSCSGSRNRYKICTTQPCDVKSHPFRDVQCAEYNDWVFPEDGQLHNWKGFYVSNDNPCALYCRNEKDVVVSLSPKVKDGTTCYRGKRDICVDGICRDIPCDLQFGSNSVEDACGVCHGNGTGCKVVQGQTNFKKGTSQILTIPVGTRNIVVEESKPTPSHFIIKTQEADNIINEGNKLGMFNISGSMGWLGMKSPNQEILEIPGPLVKPIEIWVSSQVPQSVMYSMGLPSDPRLGKYSWDYIDWSACNAQCGDSYQESVPKCVEQLSGHVEDKYCSEIQKLLVKRRSCNAGICVPRWLVGEWQECGPCPSEEAKRFRIVRCIKPIAGSEEGTMIVSDQVCPGSRPIGSESCRCIKRQVLYWQPPYTFDLLSSDFKFLKNMQKGNKTSRTPEKKVTLMQLENESEASMLKQFKENQQKHHSIFFMPRVLGSRFNFSIPFKKREVNMNGMPSQELIHLLNDNFIEYAPKPALIDLMKTGKRIMGNNLAGTTQSVDFFNLTGPRDYFYTRNVKKLKPIPTNDPPPLRFSDENILKILSVNLPLTRLKEQHYANQSNKNPFKSFFHLPKFFLNGSGFSHPKEEKKEDIVDVLMNEFNNVLATNTLVRSNIKTTPTTDDKLQHIQDVASESRGPAFENRMKVDRQPFFLSNTSGLDAAIARLQKIPTNDSNDLINLKMKNLVVNNQRVTESWIGQTTDHEWNNLLRAFKRYFFKTEYEKMKTASKAINDKLSGIDESFLFITTHPTTANVIHDNFFPLKSLTRKVNEKLNTLSYRDKLKAYELFTDLVDDLHNSLSGSPHRENEVFSHDDIPSQEIQPMLLESGNCGNVINKEKTYGFFKPVNKDYLRFNRSKNSVLNYSTPMFDKPIFSAEDLVKIKEISHSDDALIVDNVHKNKIPEYYQLRIAGKPKESPKAKTEKEQIPKYSINSLSNKLLDGFVTVFHNGRNKKETVQGLKRHRKGRVLRFVKQCIKNVTVKKKITDLYPLPPDRVCYTTTVSTRRFFNQRCRKNASNDSLKKGELSLPGKIKLVKVMRKRRRVNKPCEENTRICDELKRRFKDRLANVKQLDPYQCQRLREEIQHVKHTLLNAQDIQNDLGLVMNTNVTCLFRYTDKEYTTPFKLS